MTELKNINEKLFSINGFLYPKIFIPYKVDNERLKLISIYDVTQVILESTNYQDLSVDQNSFNNLTEAFNAITALMYGSIAADGDYTIELTAPVDGASFSENENITITTETKSANASTSPVRILIIGDSIGNGTNEIYAQPDTDDSIQGDADPDTLFEWDGSQLLELDGDTIEANNGSPYPSMANKIKELSGRKVHLVETANGGAEFAVNGDTNNWADSGGILYGQMLTKANSYLDSQEQGASFDVIRITLGINDARGNTALSEVETQAQGLITRLASDFPGTPILINQLGKSSASSSRVTAIRGYIDALIVDNEFVYAGKDLNEYPSNYYFDGLHLYQQYNNLLGEEDAQTIINII